MSDTEQLRGFLKFADGLLDETRKLIVSLWNDANIESHLKQDDTPVSVVDLRCEELVRERIHAHFPTHGIIGEEHGAENEAAEFVWTIDPIDGTQNLINRIPTFGTILSLLHHGRPILGWIDHPILNERYYGGPGIGSYRNGHQIKLKDLQETKLSPNDVVGTNCPATFARGNHLPVLDTLLRFHPHIRMYYDVYAHSLTIQGSLALMVEYNLKIWDLAGAQALIEGAGGEYRELGREEIPGKPTAYHAAFGKPRAVTLVSEVLAAK